jgi:hypothetical protein
MAKDNAVQNQKVFVTLTGFEKLVTEYRRVQDATKVAIAEDNGKTFSTMRVRKQALEWVIEALDLPISVQ